MLPAGTVFRTECNLRGAIVVLPRNEMKKETSKRTILLKTSPEMRKEIVERNEKSTECHRWQPQGKEIKQGRKV
jgi:hypothetical protein